MRDTSELPNLSLTDPRWQFSAFKIDPFFNWLASEPESRPGSKLVQRISKALPSWALPSRPLKGVAVWLWALLLVITTWLAAAAIDGNLVAEMNSEGNLRPAFHSLVTSVPGFFTPHSAAKVDLFPLFADSAVWLFAVASVITFGLLLRQWRAMAEVVPQLIERGAIQVEQEERFLRLLTRLNKTMASKLTTAGIAALAAATTAVIYLGLSQKGLYETLVPPGHQAHQWALSAYEHWWAAARPGSWLGCIAFGALLFTYLYYLIAQYTAGAVWVVLTQQGRKHVSFSFDCANMDGFFGWRPLRNLMLTVYFSIIVQVLALLPLLHLLTRGTWIYLVVPFGLFLVFNPIYVLTPLLLVSPELRERRSEFLHALADSATVDPASDVDTRFDQYAEHAKAYEFVRSMSAFPIRGRELAFGFATYGLPIAAILWHG